MPPTKKRNLLDEVRDVMRLHHYSIHTERTYSEWIKKYVHFHGMNSRDDLKNGEKKIEAFLTHLAVNKNVAPATQNQALNALAVAVQTVLKNFLSLFQAGCVSLSCGVRWVDFFGAGGRNRTDTNLRSEDFESSASTNFTTPAHGTWNLC